MTNNTRKQRTNEKKANKTGKITFVPRPARPSLTPLSDPGLSHVQKENGGRVVLMFVGFPQNEHCPRTFLPFDPTKDKVSGFGLFLCCLWRSQSSAEKERM